MTSRGSDGLTHWDRQPKLTEDDFDRDYARLLKKGITSCLTHPYEALKAPTGEPPDEWRAQVLEPWSNAMRVRAASDGLNIKCLLDCDNLWASVGLDNATAVAELLTPNGSPYAHGDEGAEAIKQKMLRDWGETLTAARARLRLPEG